MDRQEVIGFPIKGREDKPRQQGLTMVIDKGLGLGGTKDLLEVAGEYIDMIKLGFGTSVLYPHALLEEKISLIKSYGVDVYPGGTLLEIAILQDNLREYLKKAVSLGYTAIEISDGTINIASKVRAEAISMAKEMDLKVLTEVGKKYLQDKGQVGHYINQIHGDLRHGAFKVIIEGRESGKNAGFYDKNGHFIDSEMEQMLAAVDDPRALIWEAPLKQQQQDLIIRFGPNVNLGNIPAGEALALETLRTGLRGDTLRWVYRNTIK
ncbi:MAG: phosphosulfolactate synthase [Desulfotomaculaceae bacterium]|nr:phosphosulfolactate synthase [Desulfotomaculaceae bacterium]